MANHSLVPWQKTIPLHLVFFFFQLHDERGAEVNQIGVTNIWKKRIGKAIRVFFEKRSKIRFPKKVNEFGKRLLCFLTVIPEFEMVLMKKFNVLHEIKLTVYSSQFTVLCPLETEAY